MKPFLTLAMAVTATFATLPAHATILDAKFSGIVQSEQDSGFNVNDPVSGEFMYDTASGQFTMFTIAGETVAPGFTSTAEITPDQYSAIYQAQVSPLTGGTLNSTFSVDLEGISSWPTNDAIALLSMGNDLITGNLDTSNSTFSYYEANADGTNIRRLTASLTSFVVPEPGSLALTLAGLALMGRRARGRIGQTR